MNNRNYLLSATFWILLILLSVFATYCKPEKESQPPEIELIITSLSASEGDTFSIGSPIRFCVKANGIDANITNFVIKKEIGLEQKTVLDSGLNSPSFEVNQVFYQGVEDVVDWTFTVMDHNRKTASVSLRIYKDPNSQFGGIIEFQEITIGLQGNEEIGHFFLPDMDKVYMQDSASMYQELVDVLCYFYYSEDNGVNKPSATFSSPGEDINGSGYLYDDYYPFITEWEVRNYTKYDIRAVNGITEELYANTHNDSLLIVSYDDVWGKKKYKWVSDGLFIPFQTSLGRKGIIKVIEVDNGEDGKIVFSMKIQQ